jgi:acyl dehydratase
VNARSVEANDLRGLSFEDFRVGQRFDSSTRTISEEDLRLFTRLSGDAAALHVDADHARSLGFDAPLVHGPFGIAVVFGLLFESGLVEPTAIAMLDLDWRFAAPIVAGDELRFEMTVTRCRRSHGRRAGVVARHFRVLKQDDVLVQEGTSSLLVAAREEAIPGAPDPAIRSDFCAPAWAEALSAKLTTNRDFADATRSFDGSIGLRAGAEAVQLRVYRGAVLETARSTPAGPTFTVAGSELAWTRLALAERNDFVARATLGEFTTSGSSYEYLRMTKAVVAIWDAVRALAAGAGG